MPQSTTTQSKPEATALNAAFDALKSYDQGSSRGALVPIDEAVITSLDDKAARNELEQRLITALKSAGSPVASEYICSKLTLIASDASVKALAALLDRPELATAARNTLEAIPGRPTTTALRGSLSKVEGLQKVGLINSLGERRDADSVRTLVALLKNSNLEVAGAAAAALGDIATAKAAKALSVFLPKAPVTLRPKLTDALLKCAERLLAAGASAEGQRIYRALDTPAQPAQVRLAAAIGLKQSPGRE